MSATRTKLQQVTTNLSESVGLERSLSDPQLTPVAQPADLTRRPLRQFGSIAIERVLPDPDQPRKVFDQQHLVQLAESIRDKGQLSPIRVRWSVGHERWIIISGERRWRAAQLAELVSIECCFVESNFSGSEVLEEQLIENLIRADLDPTEEARAFDRLIRENAWTSKELSQRLQIHPSRVSRMLALLKLPIEIQEQVDSGQISCRTGYELSRANDSEIQSKLARRACEGELTHEDTAQAVGRQRRRVRSIGRTKQLRFDGDDDIQINVRCQPHLSYDHIEAALVHALDEVRLRIRNRISL